MDVQTKELFGSMFEDVFQKALRTSALVPHQRHVFSLSQPAVTVQSAYYVIHILVPAVFGQLV